VIHAVLEEDFDDDVNDPTYEPDTDTNSDEHNTDQDRLVQDTSIQIDHEETVVSENVQRKRRKKGSSRLKHKMLRMKGKAYSGMKKTDDGWKLCVERNERVLCPRNCSKRCEKSKVRHCNDFTEEDRRNIFDQFWGTMDWNQRKVYVNGIVESGDKATTNNENSRRQKSFRYFLWKNEQRVSVCKGMFLSTLGIGEQTVFGWCRDAENGIPRKVNKGMLTHLFSSYQFFSFTHILKMPFKTQYHNNFK